MKRQIVRRGFRHLLSEAHTAARAAIGALTPERRGRLSKAGYCQVTHFYGWLRGNDSSLSLETLDKILRSLDLTLTWRGDQIVCRPACRNAKL
jgi:hypothetical protein